MDNNKFEERSYTSEYFIVKIVDEEKFLVFTNKESIYVKYKNK